MLRRLSVALAVLWAVLVPPSAWAQPWSQRLVGPRARAELRHADASVRARAAATLGREGEHHRSVAALLEMLESEEDARVRATAFDALARRGEEAAVPRLAERMQELGREDRARALRTVAAIGGESAIRVAIEWLAAPDVGQDAADGLVRLAAPAVPHLLRALREPALAERAARVLGRIGDARATVALVQAMEAASPTLRVAIVEALGRLADERASPVIVTALGDPSPEVAEAALVAAAAVLGPEHAGEVEARSSPERFVALEALVALDPERAAPRVLAALRDPAVPAMRAAAARVAVERPHRALVPALVELAGDPAHRSAAADALARAPGGAGLSALVALAEGDPALEVSLALGLRRHRGDADAALVARADRHLLADGSLRGARLAALASQPSALPRLELALASAEPRDRIEAALGIAALGGEGLGAARLLLDRLRVEEEPAVFRCLALAASSLRQTPPVDLDGPLLRADTAPEAFWLVADGLGHAPARTRARIGRLLRASLRSADPRVRSGAALALARAGDRAAWRALAAVLEDPHETVRLAAARALGTLAVAESRGAVAGRERVETHLAVRRALRSTLEACRTGRALPPVVVGREVLHVRVATAPGAASPEATPSEVDVRLPDGRWLRLPISEGGEVLVPDLPSDEAEVELRP